MERKRNRTKKQMEARLPVTPCSAQTRDRMVEVAEKSGISLAEAQRRAFDLFLSKYDTKRITNGHTLEQHP